LFSEGNNCTTTEPQRYVTRTLFTSRYGVSTRQTKLCGVIV